MPAERNKSQRELVSALDTKKVGSKKPTDRGKTARRRKKLEKTMNTIRSGEKYSSQRTTRLINRFGRAKGIKNAKPKKKLGS